MVQTNQKKVIWKLKKTFWLSNTEIKNKEKISKSGSWIWPLKGRLLTFHLARPLRHWSGQVRTGQVTVRQWRWQKFSATVTCHGHRHCENSVNSICAEFQFFQWPSLSHFFQFFSIFCFVRKGQVRSLFVFPTWFFKVALFHCYCFSCSSDMWQTSSDSSGSLQRSPT